jgi:hypothetical protein
MLKPMKNPVTYFFGFSNGLATNQKLGKLEGIPFLVLMVVGSMNLLAEPHNTLDFWFLEIADAKQHRCTLLEKS